ncbi:hypothetical protein [Salinigranum sp. GCM10025319]|uniref:hypothetical protein n=1 Tax=Salinigranum sp. GCM10025319 TaxID=3252687 RepID=UPI00360B2A08
MGGPDGSRENDDPLDDLLSTLAAELRATEELAVDPAASVWLGEAHAVAEDLDPGLDRSVIHERVGHVRRLLGSAGDLDNAIAAERVSTALDAAEAIHERTRES